MGDMPRSEYPRPQFVRPDWLCLNGEWQFEIDAGDSGEERGLVTCELEQRITVPFCPESALSGIEHRDFMSAVWYRRAVDVPAAWAGRRVLLHFQAVDDEATVWVDGERRGWHRGGWTPFTVDLGDVGGRTVTVVVRARDDHRQPKGQGKQSSRYANHGCFYTRTTGIWQTVWMEPVPNVAMARPRITPDVGRGVFHVAVPLDAGRPRGSVRGLSLRVVLRAGDAEIVRTECPVADLTPGVELTIPEDQRRLWSPADPFLYDMDLALCDASGTVVDQAGSYAGLRSVVLDGRRVLINGESVFQRTVLDQGYYPDGIMTAPSDAALRRDIELAMEAGFNGARLHQKVFEERFLYHADRLGYLLWGEYGDWRIQWSDRLEEMVHGWTEAVRRDVSHPSIIGWCALNEQRHYRDPEADRMAGLIRTLVAVTRAIDPTRPVLDVSGGYHCDPTTDVLDTHDYSQDAAELRVNCERVLETDTGYWANPPFAAPPLEGRPFWVSEFGGTWWQPTAADEPDDRGTSWGYGERPATVEQFYERFAGLCGVLLNERRIFGYCYTQLTDVFQEQNGIYTFDRRAKFDNARLRAIQQQPAAIEAE